jgi:hypothetical protein
MPCAPRLVPPVAALALVVLAAVPAGAQEPPPRPPAAVGRVACGGYEIVPSGFRANGEPTRLTIQKGGRLLVTLTDGRVTAAECDDITADAVPELLVRTSSGGAHCCETLRVYALADAPRLLLLYEGNNAEGVEVRDLNGDARRELVLGDDSFAYFDDLCYACSPANLPLVACFAGGRFEDCTRQFPDLLRARRDAAIARLKDSAGRADDRPFARGAALAIAALSELLGEGQQGVDLVRKIDADEALLAWLVKSLPQVREWASTRGQKLKDGK